MNHSRFDFAKRVTAAIVLALFMSQVSLPVWGTARAWAAPVPMDKVDTRAVLKAEAALDETDRTTGGARKANVLIMVEATPPMSYTPRGVTPTTIRDWDWYNNEEAINWTKTKQYYGMDFDDINNANWHATFGIGMMPPAWSGQNLRKERNLYGRERLEQNNLSEDLDLGSITVDEFIELNKDKYYFPFRDPAAASKVRDAYKSQTTKLETHFTDVPVVPKFPTNLDANMITPWFTNTTDT